MDKTKVFGLSLLTVTIILHFMYFMLTGASLRAGVVGGFWALVSIVVVSLISTGIITMITRVKERYWVAFVSNTAFLIVAVMAASAITRYVIPRLTVI